MGQLHTTYMPPTYASLSCDTPRMGLLSPDQEARRRGLMCRHPGCATTDGLIPDGFLFAVTVTEEADVPPARYGWQAAACPAHGAARPAPWAPPHSRLPAPSRAPGGGAPPPGDRPAQQGPPLRPIQPGATTEHGRDDGIAVTSLLDHGP